MLFYSVPLRDEVDAISWRHVKRGFETANLENADAIILNLNTYGGAVDYADSIRTLILNSTIPVYAYIDNNAASAGALIAIACDSIYMRKGGNIGAATVVNGMDGAAMPDKYQSYMRSMIRSTAESHGKHTMVTESGDTVMCWVRDPLVAEAMVDARTVIPGITPDSTRVLTFTALEAQKNGYCEGICESEKDLIENALKVQDYELKQYNPSRYDTIIGFLTSPGFQAILIMIMIGGIYFEMQTPGIGFPSLAAIVAALLYFIPLYLTGTAADWEIILFIAGIIALILEIFVIPGFGIAGITGIVLIVFSLLLACVDNVVFSFDNVQINDIWFAIATVLGGIILSLIFIIWLSHKIGSKHGFMRHTALQLEQKVKDGYIGVPVNLDNQIGKTGVTVTIMRTSGTVSIDDVEYDAVSVSGFLDASVPVIVVRTENAQLYVKKLD